MAAHKPFEVLEREFVFRQCPTAMCHGSTVLPLGNGDVVAAWFGGSVEGADDTSIWYALRRDGMWSSPAAIARVSEAHWNPVLRCDADGAIHLYFKVGSLISDWRTYTCQSRDNGLTWSVPREMLPGDGSGGRGPVRNKIIRLSSGRLLAPASTESGLWTAFADISDDDGRTWNKSGTVAIKGLEYNGESAGQGSGIAVSEQSFNGRGVIQPTLWEDEAGVHMLLRSTEGCIYRSDSKDAGSSWSDAYPTEVPNNNSGIDVCRLDSGCLVLACNPVAANWGIRSPLSLLLSTDGGECWNTLFTPESGQGEFSYPAIVAEKDTFHLTYTWKRSRIAYLRVRVDGR